MLSRRLLNRDEHCSHLSGLRVRSGSPEAARQLEVSSSSSTQLEKSAGQHNSKHQHMKLVGFFFFFPVYTTPQQCWAQQWRPAPGSLTYTDYRLSSLWSDGYLCWMCLLSQWHFVSLPSYLMATLYLLPGGRGDSLRRPAALIKRKLKRHLKFPRRSNEKREVHMFVSDLGWKQLREKSKVRAWVISLI